MNIKLLKLLSQNARYDLADLAVMSGITEDEAKKEIAQITDKPVKTIIYTHQHGDHTSGAAALKIR